MAGLTISGQMDFPLDYATRRVALLATSGAGKSNASVVLAEAMYDAGVPWYAIDPKGDWWGVRSSGDGTKPGLHVPIFGGDHGDIPLEPTAGKVIAETIAKQRLSCVLDVSQFATRQELYGFLADFADTLLKRNVEPLHGFLDECHEYLPQTPRDKGAQMRCLGAWERLVGKGRNKGLGTTQISQRSALVNKNTLDLADCMIALRTISPRDIAAVRGWFETKLTGEELRGILTTLPSLKNGEAWVYAPEWMPGPPRRMQFNRRWTFDSAATPEVGKSVTRPSTLADIDLTALGSRIAETVERVKADDPKVLRARIAELERRKPDTGEADALRQDVADLKVIIGDYQRLLRHMVEFFDEGGELADDIRAALSAPQPASPPPTPIRAVPKPPPPTVRPSGGALPEYDRKMLVAAAQRHPAPSTPSQIALLSRNSRKSSQFGPRLRALVASGYLAQEGNFYRVTSEGFDVLGGYEEPPAAGMARVGWWVEKLPAYEASLFSVLASAYPLGLDKVTLAERAGKSLTSSAFMPALNDLRSRDLVVAEGGEYRVAHELFGAAS